MDKNAIKKYAVWARNELIARVTQKAEQYEITEKKITPKDADSINGRLLTDAEKNQRKALIEKIQADGFEQVMEEVAYTWFNRFTALRFMEVNNYLPSRTRVFTNEAGEFKPQILSDAIQLDLEELDMDKVFELKDANKTEELYKYLLITQCNALSAVLPRMFQKIEHYTELLLPDYLLREGSVIEQIIALIPEEDWTDQVQIIGWLYQYYNSEPKDAVFAALKKNVKISKENIPAATQLFTPDWIVRYMVENSLGRLWLEGHPNDSLKSEWNYYLDETEQEANVQKQLDEIHKEYAELKPEDIRCIDPCMGSGHILCYMFDVLVKIYEDYGYTAREAVGNIVEKNLWGLDIDERAAQLSYFAVMMKARQYDRRFLTRGIQPHVYAIEESNGITSVPMHDMGIELSQEDYGKAAKEAMRLVEEMRDAKEYGSIIHVTPCDWDLLRRFAVPRGTSEGQMMLDIHGEIEASERLQKLIDIGETISQKYHAVVTNPPYMGGGGMQGTLAEYLAKNYSIGKSDLFSAFMIRTSEYAVTNGFVGLLTPYVWMFIASYADLREKLISEKHLESMTQLEYNAFPEACVPVCTFVIRNTRIKDYRSEFIKLSDFKGVAIQEPKTLEAIHNRDCGYRFSISPDEFLKIPGTSIAYWLKSESIDVFQKGKPLSDEAYIITKGIFTGDNNRFLRLWFEVNYQDIKEDKWNLYVKGGPFRRWYGNIEYLVLWENNKGTLANYPKSGLGASKYFGMNSFVWSKITNSLMSFRVNPRNVFFDDASPAVVFSGDLDYYLLGLMNSKAIQYYLDLLSPTMNNQIGDIKKVPVLRSSKYEDEVVSLVKHNIELAKQDFDSSEMSFDFKKMPLLCYKTESLKEAVQNFMVEKAKWHSDMKANEERLNAIFIEMYGLHGTITEVVDDSAISISEVTQSDLIKAFISYSVGCMFGRYSLDEDGIVYAGGEWDSNRYKKYKADVDNILPICDDEYFTDDIVGRFVEFVKTVFGPGRLEENLQYIAEQLGGTGNSREVVRQYFINDFFSDHCNQYTSRGAGKRPIYWLFDSGKKNGFKCLIYMHRYQQDTIARIRTDYVHEQQSRYRTAISELESRIANAGTGDRVKLSKQLRVLLDQEEELRNYEEKIHHLADQMIRINIDDGIRQNYPVFQDVLAKIK